VIPLTDYSQFIKGKGPYPASAFEYRSQADNYMRYLTGLMTITERKNVSSINRPFLDYRNQASLNNFVTDPTWNDDASHQSAIRMVKDEVDRLNIKGGTLVIDDTLIEKSGKHIWGQATSGTMVRKSICLRRTW
jgi:SRSO17 transposase